MYTRDTASPLGIQEPINANRITLVEKWSSLAALQVHTEQAHMKEFGPQIQTMRESVTARVTEPAF